MRYSSQVSLVTLELLALTVAGQFTNWVEGQVNTSICYWSQPRAALIRDTVYLDGGNIYWSAGLENGEYAQGQKTDSNTLGYILSYNLSRPFSPDTNRTGILVENKISKGRGNGEGLANGAGPNYVDGAMLANNDKFFLYGGLVPKREHLYKTPPAQAILSYERYRETALGDTAGRGFFDWDLPEDITRYITYGGAASAPSENKAWYFSGLASPSRGVIYDIATNKSESATEISNTLITLDMDEPQGTWTNVTFKNPKGRANPEAVWVPVGEQGILVVLGGVVHPQWITVTRKSDDPEASKKESPEFMRTIDIYDVASKKWYKQSTSEGPGARTRGCAVVAPASDYTSYNIYYYGGFDGIDASEPFYDDVWVLSLPSFTWTQLNNGTESHARAGHKCFMPYSDQMMVFGGYPSTGGAACLEEPVVIFNMTSGEWMDSYDPAKYGTYGVPDKVRDKIGGNAAGEATMTEPAKGWATSELGEVFAKEYDHSKIKDFGPWPVEGAPKTRPDQPRPENGNGDGEDGGGSGLPSWLAPVLGVVLGLILVTVVVVAFIFWRRRKVLKNGPSEAGTEDAGMRIMSWMRGQQPSQPLETKAPTVTTSEEMPASNEYHPRPIASVSPPPQTVYSGYSRYEMDASEVMELDDTSPPAELGFTHVGVNRRQSQNGTPGRSRSLSKPSSVSGDDMNDAISQASVPISGNAAPETGLVDSPTLANQANERAQVDGHRASEISMVTNRASHLRNLSDTTVSSEGTHVESRPAPERMSHPAVQPIPEGREEPDNRPSSAPAADGPVSPPTADETNADDYLSVKPLVSPITKSAFPDIGEPSERK